jgi:biotin operon repressor
MNRRPKLFGDGRPVPLDREAKVRIMVLARALSHPTEKGKHYGVVTAKFLNVLEALLWGFHNARSGLCFPSYETIAARAHCNRDTVYEAIHALEDAGILTWVNRIKRIREWGPDLFGRAQNHWRVVRTSNGYAFIDPKLSKSEFPTGTPNQDLILPMPQPAQRALDPDSPLDRALMRLGRLVMEEGKD